jgi:hypothetical protein
VTIPRMYQRARRRVAETPLRKRSEWKAAVDNMWIDLDLAICYPDDRPLLWSEIARQWLRLLHG